MARVVGAWVLTLWLTGCGIAVDSNEPPANERWSFEPTTGAASPADPKTPPSASSAPSHRADPAAPGTDARLPPPGEPARNPERLAPAGNTSPPSSNTPLPGSDAQLPGSDAQTPGSARVSFDDQGALTAVDVERPLHFPNLDGSEGAPIDLDFGAPRIAGVGGVDGLTAFPMSSFLSSASKDGHQFRLQACSKLPSESDAMVPIEYVLGTPPVCANISSHRLSANGALNSASPLVTGEWNAGATRGPGEHCSVISLVDAALRLVPAELCFRHLAANVWDVHLLSHAHDDAAELARVRLLFDQRGVYAGEAGERSFTLPLSDGSPGPRITLDLGFSSDGSVSSGGVWSVPGPFSMRLYTDGMRKAECATAKVSFERAASHLNRVALHEHFGVDHVDRDRIARFDF